MPRRLLVGRAARVLRVPLPEHALMGAPQNREAGLRQCARGKHTYSSKANPAVYEHTCRRCGKNIRRRGRLLKGEWVYGPADKH
jgi:hypothetical protein